jgi:hypothetical protein
MIASFGAGVPQPDQDFVGGQGIVRFERREGPECATKSMPTRVLNCATQRAAIALCTSRCFFPI